MSWLRDHAIATGIIRPAARPGDPTQARWIDKATLRLDAAAHREVERARFAEDSMTDDRRR